MSTYVWSSETGEFVPRETTPVRLDVADSWRHSAGRAHGLGLHLARFSRAAGALPEGFVTAMCARIEQGERFPRIARAQGHLLLDDRPAPPPRTTTRLTYPLAPDPRTTPLVKGPDFGALADYRRAYQREGTDDTVIADARGNLLETTTGALVAWADGELIVPAGTWLPSVTMRQVTDRATQLGIGVRQMPLTVALAGAHPLWFLNSLHGISPVTELHTPTGLISPPAHPLCEQWQAWWWAGFTTAGAAPDQ